MVQGGACQTQRADVVSPQAHSRHLETDPERAREKQRRTSHVTGPQVHSESLVPNVFVSNITSLLASTPKMVIATSSRSVSSFSPKRKIKAATKKEERETIHLNRHHPASGGRRDPRGKREKMPRDRFFGERPKKKQGQTVPNVDERRS